MRRAFINALCDRARRCGDVWLIVGDVGYGVVEPFTELAPDHYINAGVAEQAMVGAAAGIASMGDVAVTYSIANFGSLRCLEQIRNDVCHDQRRVLLATVGSGKGYADAGYSHFGLEDVAVIRSLPEITILSPTDDERAYELTCHALAANGPVYLRMSKEGRPPESRIAMTAITQDAAGPLATGRSASTVMVANGTAADTAADSWLGLRRTGIDVDLVVFPQIWPLPIDVVHGMYRTADKIIVIEDHVITGGFGSAISEVRPAGAAADLVRVGLSPWESDEVGDEYAAFGRLDGDQLTEFVKSRVAP